MKIKYIASFDGLRGIAVISLMLVHGSYGYFGGGVPRVDMFYMMSGFLISYLLYSEYLSTGTIEFRKFFARRALRLFPALIVCIILSNILWPFTPLAPENDRAIATLSSLFFFNNIIFDDVLGNLNHLWSLSVEEHFYFIWPIIAFLILFRLTNHNRILFLSVLLVGLEIFRVIAFLNQDQWRYGIFWISPYGFTLCRVDCIVIGALLFFILYREKYNYGKLRNSSHDNLFLIGLALIFLISGLVVRVLDHPRWLSGGFILTNIVCVFTVLIAIRNPNHPILAHKALLWIGRRSYGIYLYHMPVFLYLERFRTLHDVKNLVVVTFFRFAISIAFAAFSYRYIEQPILEYKNRYKSKTGPVVNT